MTPAWIRNRKRREKAETTAIRAELMIQAHERIEEEAASEEWVPRRGMSFASEE